MDTLIHDKDLSHHTFSYKIYMTHMPIDAMVYYHDQVSLNHLRNQGYVYKVWMDLTEQFVRIAGAEAL